MLQEGGNRYERAWLCPQKEETRRGSIGIKVARRNRGGRIELFEGSTRAELSFPSLESLNEAYESACIFLYVGETRFNALHAHLVRLSKKARADLRSRTMGRKAPNVSYRREAEKVPVQ